MPSSLKRWISPATSAAVLALYSAVATLTFLGRLGRPLEAEDSAWIRGLVLGSPTRLTAHHLLHDVLLPLLGTNLLGYRVSTYAIHLLNAWLVFLLVKAVGSHLRDEAQVRSRHVTLGATLAGLLFLLHHSRAVDSVAAMSYMLAVLASLCVLLLAAAYFRHRRAALWIPLAAAYGLALISNLQTFCLPLVVAGLELSWSRAPQRRRPLRGVLLRYGALAAVFGLFLARFWHGTAGHGVNQLGQLAHTGQSLLDFPRYLLFPLALLSPSHERLAFVLTTGGWEAFAAVALLVPAIIGVRQLLWRRARLGLLGGWVVLSLLWSAAVFPLLLTVNWNANPHRYYILAVGLCTWLGFSAYRVLALAPARFKRVPVRACLAVTLVAGAALLWLGHPIYRGEVAQVLSGGYTLSHAGVWRPCSHCPNMERADAAQVTAAHRQGRSTSCLDLTRQTLHNAKLGKATLHGVALVGARLKKVDLRRADCRHSTFLWSSIHETDLRGANLAGADLSGVESFHTTLEGADLRGATLRWSSFLQCSLSKARLDGANMLEAEIQHSDLRGATLRDADLRGAKLRQSDLRGADLRGARLDASMLHGALYDQHTRFSRHFNPQHAGMQLKSRTASP